ncbi:alpha/beta fold hydrolase [Aerosticca soli]|uniref:Hydrolase, alpha/beta fold family n=1 Tax=Aerosticca soli TaxID=2010829 RepID=A0A2Z6E6R6_9GAMM|nr:alpha/beta hydrolase [Aerosticca soli]BBD80865.1 hydrolase, alpha/beta fold family [Aerosticca soli]
MTAATELSLTLPHLRLAAQVWGDAQAPALVALHGWLDNAGSFAHLAPLLARQFRVIALDLPGHGHADHLPPGPAGYPFTDYVYAVRDALTALGIERCAVLGHSMGAGVASLLAAALPERVTRLWLIESLGPLADEGDTLKRFRQALAATTERKPLRLFRDLDQAVRTRSVATGLRADLARPIVERGLRAEADGWAWRSDPRLLLPTPIRLAESQVRALLAGIAAPTDVLLARPASPYLPEALMRERAACVPRVRLTHMDGGHHLHLEHPQAVARWMETAAP